MGTEIVLSNQRGQHEYTFKGQGGFTRQDLLFTPAIAEEICERYAMGETIKAICRDKHLPERWTVIRWALVNKGGWFREMYEMAQAIHCLGWADEILEIADDASEDQGENAQAAVYRSKLRCDNRKWLLSKILPMQFGDKPGSTKVARRQLVIQLVKAHLPPAEDGTSSNPAA